MTPTDAVARMTATERQIADVMIMSAQSHGFAPVQITERGAVFQDAETGEDLDVTIQRLSGPVPAGRMRADTASAPEVSVSDDGTERMTSAGSKRATAVVVTPDGQMVRVTLERMDGPVRDDALSVATDLAEDLRKSL